MTGLEHYKQAERLIDERSLPPAHDLAVQQIALAQVHATLALAAGLAGSGQFDQVSTPFPGTARRDRAILVDGYFRPMPARGASIVRPSPRVTKAVRS
jgi:hypothetical protein